MKLKEIAKAWYDDHRQYVKESTSSAYAMILNNHIIPYFGESENITEEDLQKYVNDKISGGLGIRPVRDTISVIKMLLRFGAKKKWCEPPVDWKMIYPSRTMDSKRVETWSPAHQKKMIEYLKENFSFRNLGLLIVMETGMRIGEISGLQWGNIDIQNKTLHIQRTVERVVVFDGLNGKKGTKVRMGSTKTINSNREIPLSKDILMFVRPLSKICVPNYYVVSNDASPAEPRLIRNYFNRLCKELKLPRIKFHGLRHTFATSLIASKCDIKTVSSILGHANVSITLDLYVHPNNEQKISAINTMLRRVSKSEEEGDFDISQIRSNA
nr:site-specific integrase [Prevotella sp.]